MYAQEVLRLYPQKRVKAYDGMAVTADTWDASHDYHRRLLEVHTRFAHGPGIVYGLDVFAGEPPGGQIYVQPGLAVDALGRTIILPEQRGYDLRAIDGTIYLVLTYEESQPRSEGPRSDDAPRFVFSEYALQALLTLPQTPYIEIARLRRQAGAPIQNARDADQPALNEIDLRWRTQVGARTPALVRSALITIGGRTDSGHAAGALNLARFLRAAGAEQRLVVDPLPAFDRSLAGYDMLLLVGQGDARLNNEQAQALYEFLRQGGFVFYESCRSQGTGEPAADAAFLELLDKMNVKLQPVGEGHPLLREPNFFAAPPDGFETQGSPRLLADERILFSGYDYNCLWQGKRRGRAAGRGEIRSALEFGQNVVAAVAHMRKVQP